MNISFNKKHIIAASLAIVVLLLPSLGLATDLSSFEKGVCKLYKCFFSSTVVSLIATFAVIFLGIGAFFGKTNWGLVITVLAGIVVVLGAATIVGQFGGVSLIACADVQC